MSQSRTLKDAVADRVVDKRHHFPESPQEKDGHWGLAKILFALALGFAGGWLSRRFFKLF